MGFLNLPDPVAKQVWTAAEIQQIIAALQGFSAQSGDIGWPLLCQGHIDFDGLYTLENLRTLWGVHNADEYDSLQAAIDAAESAGGGAVFIPPDTTVEVEDVTVEASNITIFGAGSSSVLQLGASVSSFGFQTANTGLTDIVFRNLTFDGASKAVTGISARGMQRFKVRDVYFKNMGAGKAIHITTGSGGAGDYSTDAEVSDCTFYNGGAEDILIDNLVGGKFHNNHSEDCGATAFLAEPASSSAYIQYLEFSNTRVDNPTTHGISILGSGAAADDKWSRNAVRNCQVYSAGSDGLRLGETAKLLKDTSCTGCSIHDAAGDGITVLTEGGLIDGYFIEGTTDDGIDQLTSTNLVIGTGQILNSTGDDFTSGMKHVGPFMSTNSTAYTKANGATGDLGYALTIPANTVKIGDMVRIRAFFSSDAAGDTISVRSNLEAVSIGTTNDFSASVGMWIEWNCHIVALSGADSTYVPYWWVWTAGSTRAHADKNDVTIDWTADVDVTFEVVASGGTGEVKLRGVTVEILGGV